LTANNKLAYDENRTRSEKDGMDMMKTRSAIKIASFIIGLIMPLAALPLQAQNTQSVSNFVFDIIYDDGRMKFHWTTVNGEYENQIQFKGGDITNVFTTLLVSNVQYSPSTGTTGIIVAPITEDPTSLAGKTIHFRVRVTVCETPGQTPCASASTTDWTTLDVTF